MIGVFQPIKNHRIGADEKKKNQSVQQEEATSEGRTGRCLRQSLFPTENKMDLRKLVNSRQGQPPMANPRGSGGEGGRRGGYAQADYRSYHAYYGLAAGMSNVNQIPVGNRNWNRNTGTHPQDLRALAASSVVPPRGRKDDGYLFLINPSKLLTVSFSVYCLLRPILPSFSLICKNLFCRKKLLINPIRPYHPMMLYPWDPSLHYDSASAYDTRGDARDDRWSQARDNEARDEHRSPAKDDHRLQSRDSQGKDEHRSPAKDDHRPSERKDKYTAIISVRVSLINFFSIQLLIFFFLITDAEERKGRPREFAICL